MGDALMEYEDVLFYSWQERDQLQKEYAKADNANNISSEQFNAHWDLLEKIHNDLLDRFVRPVIDQLSDDARSIMMSRVENAVSKHDYIEYHIEAATFRDLSSYAGHLKNMSLMAIELCQFHKVYDDIESICFYEKDQKIMMNGESLYFLGDTI